MTDNFTTHYDLYQNDIYRYCFWKCRDADIGHDLTQETFLRFWLYLQRDEEIVHVRAFLYRIAHNLFVSHIRKKKEASLDGLLEKGFEPAVDTWEKTHSRLDAAKPMKKLANMRGPYKKALHHRYILGLAPAEIATLTGETPNAVSVRIFRGLKHLRRLLDDDSKEHHSISSLTSYVG